MATMQEIINQLCILKVQAFMIVMFPFQGHIIVHAGSRSLWFTAALTIINVISNT